MSKGKGVPFDAWICINPKGAGRDKTFIRLTSDFMNCKPFTNLGYSAQILYLRMCEAAAGRIEFKYPYSYYKGRMTKPTFSRAKSELIENGFIVEVQNNKNLRKANIYRFSNEWHRGLPSVWR